MKFFKSKFINFLLVFCFSLAMMSFYKFGLDSDGPPALTPQQSLKEFQISPEFKIELVASEPLINEPTAVCWDAEGQLYASELHGYNLEGQLEIEDLNKTGKIDTIVRRIEAEAKYKKAAEAGTYGTIKKLVDTNGDGEMDKSIVFADRIAPAYGLCAAREGLIIAGQTSVLYLRDGNQDGKAEIIDTLFSGFQGGLLERGINAPQWGSDGWIYFGRGWNGGLITGPNLKKPVDLPGSNFRIKADGSAIEPVTGSTHTIGHAFTADGDSFFSNTWKHALYAAPIPWQYLLRNPDASISDLEGDASDYAEVFPTAAVHPWKLARSNQKEWNSLYSKYGLAESAAGGYFTSSCSPMIYQDNLFSKEFEGNLMVCEPGQSLVHRCLVLKDGTGLKVKRAKNELNREFLSSKDSWFRPVSLVTAPDGSIYVTDMYREIIEDYSAVPRFMQQKYGLKNGMKHGRIWRISPKNSPKLANVKFEKFDDTNLEKLLNSPHYWYKNTADRLICEKQGLNAEILVKRQLKIENVTINTTTVLFVKTLRQQDTALTKNNFLARKLALMSAQISDQRKLLQLVLSLGYSKDNKVFESLTNIARKHGSIRWMPDAILTGMNQRSEEMLVSLLQNSGLHGSLLLEPLAESVAARNDQNEVNHVFQAVAKSKNTLLKLAVLNGLSKNIGEVKLTKLGKDAIENLLNDKNIAVKGKAVNIAGKLKMGDSKLMVDLTEKAILDISNQKLSIEDRLSAISLVADAPDEIAGPNLVNSFEKASLPMKTAILDALIYRGNRIKYIIGAITENKISANILLPLQRTNLLERADGVLRPKLDAVLASNTNFNKEAFYNTYALALDKQGDTKNGKELFGQLCSVCHKVNDLGINVGPDLKNSFSNSNQTILRNIIFPSEKIASSYEIYTVVTNKNESYSGVMASESAASVVLRNAGGNEKTFLRKNIKKLSSSATSLMPDYSQALSAKECADIIFWLKEALSSK